MGAISVPMFNPLVSSFVGKAQLVLHKDVTGVHKDVH